MAIMHKQNPLCSETPSDCTFRLIEYEQQKNFHYEETETHCVVYCRKGELKITSNLFAEEVLHEGEIMFLPRLNDYRGVVPKDTELLIHEFNNTVCRPEQCILAYLYLHRKSQAGQLCYLCKLTACQAVVAFFSAISLYANGGKGDNPLWQMKHMELIWIFTRYYSIEELRSFFFPITGEQVPFKSLVLTHYRKANQTEELAQLCGYPLSTFRRIFKKEFNIPVYQWLVEKRAEHISHKLSMQHVPFIDIMDEFNFSSPQHFNSFCKQYLGDTPSNLRKK